ncbi:hypothetical protein Aperf_G00000041154 [Anoplocephala perfoliata]
MIFKSSKTLELVDIPGSEKLRFECINKRKANSTGVIYVLDSTSIQKDLKDVAEYLFDLMTDASLARSRAPFLILCNKTDLPDAKKMDTIEELLEMELTTLSRTKADGLASLDGNQELRVPLVKNTNEKFTFAKCRHHPVTFAECSAISSDVGVLDGMLERLQGSKYSKFLEISNAREWGGIFKFIFEELVTLAIDILKWSRQGYLS